MFLLFVSKAAIELLTLHNKVIEISKCSFFLLQQTVYYWGSFTNILHIYYNNLSKKTNENKLYQYF